MVKVFIADPSWLDLLSYLGEGIEFSSMEECDVIIPSCDQWMAYPQKLVQHLLDELGGKTTKPVLLFWVTDSCDTYNYPPNVYALRTSLYRSLCDKSHENVLANVMDPIPRDMFFFLPKTPRPIVGFCGCPWDNRKPLLNALRKCPDVVCDFIEREQFWGGKPHDPVLVREFRKNMLSAHFNMCSRGAGNFSIRFYQSLSVGRVPILMDTDMILPFEDEIPWDEICVRSSVNEEDLIQKMLTFYHSRDIEKTQQQILDIYDKYFDQEAYFTCMVKKFYDHYVKKQ